MAEVPQKKEHYYDCRLKETGGDYILYCSCGIKQHNEGRDTMRDYVVGELINSPKRGADGEYIPTDYIDKIIEKLKRE